MGDYTQVNRVDGIGWIMLNRPESFNALDLPTARELMTELIALRAAAEVRGIIITGAGEAFSAGGDIKRAVNHPSGPTAAFHELATVIHVCINEIRTIPKPVIAAINGVAAGGGFSLALACDFRVIAESARLKQGFTSNALCIDAGGTFMLPRLVGHARALEIATFDDYISAAKALDWGLVTEVVPDTTLCDAATAMMQRIFAKSLHTFAWSKQLIATSFETPLETQLDRERAGLVSCAGHPDGEEGMHAFLQKRKPKYNH